MRAQKHPHRQRIATTMLVVLVVSLACRPAPAASDSAPGAPATVATTTDANRASGPAPRQKLHASYSGVQVVQAPMWMALEGGYFHEQGLDADLILISSGATLLAAMRNGEVELAGTGGSTLLLGYLEGLQTQLIAASAKYLDASIFVRPDIRTLDELRGATLGVNRLKSTNDAGTRLALQRLGLRPDVDFYTRGTGGQAESLAALEAGAIDGAIFGPPFLFEGRRRGYNELVKIGEMRLLFLGGALGATRSFLDQQPEVVDRALRALAQGMNRFKTDRDFTTRVLSKYSQMDDAELLAATVDYYAPLFDVDLYPDREAMQVVIESEEHPAARTTRPEDVTDYRFADRLRSSGFLEQLAR